MSGQRVKAEGEEERKNIAVLCEKIDALSGRIKALEELVIKSAEQRVELENLTAQVNALWKKHDILTSPEGTIQTLRAHQGGCPRGQLKWIRTAIIALGGAMVTMFGYQLMSIHALYEAISKIAVK